MQGGVKGIQMRTLPPGLWPIHNRGGQRGPQKDLLLPDTYYINPLQFKVISEKAGEVKPGEVAVIVSNVGKDPTQDIRSAMAKKVREKLEREERETRRLWWPRSVQQK